MQKFIFINSSDPFGLDNINSALEEGWRAVEVNTSVPTQGEDIKALVLLEKDKPTQKKQKIICLNQGSGTAYDNLNRMLEEGWSIRQMQAGSAADGSSCFVWIEK